ncbi:MAG: hypothetical protein HXY24_15760, partial [Rubrivivax sp.]|nr:hypothetical protein [Rubrivivax sp.]
MIVYHGGEIRGGVRSSRKIEGVTDAWMTFGAYDEVAALEVDDINHGGHIVSRSMRPIPGVAETIAL